MKKEKRYFLPPLLPPANEIDQKERKMKTGKLIVIEGLDGVGKTTLINKLIVELKRNWNIKSTIFRGFIEGPFWKSVMLSKKQMISASYDWSLDFDRGIQSAVFLAYARYELPILLAQNQIVFADRWILYKAVYCRKSYKGEIGFAEKMLYQAKDIPDPKLLIYLEALPNVVEKRIEKRVNQGGKTRDWRENIQELIEAAHWYNLLLKEPRFRNYSFRIDANKTINEVFNAALGIISPLLREVKRVDNDSY